MSSLDEARAKLPLDRLMQTYGYDVPARGTGRSSSLKCPFCDSKSASMRESKGKTWFKCFHTSCPSGTCGEKGGWDEVRFYGWKHGLSTAGASADVGEVATGVVDGGLQAAGGVGDGL